MICRPEVGRGLHTLTDSAVNGIGVIGGDFYCGMLRGAASSLYDAEILTTGLLNTLGYLFQLGSLTSIEQTASQFLNRSAEWLAIEVGQIHANIITIATAEIDDIIGLNVQKVASTDRESANTLGSVLEPLLAIGLGLEPGQAGPLLGGAIFEAEIIEAAGF